MVARRVSQDSEVGENVVERRIGCDDLLLFFESLGAPFQLEQRVHAHDARDEGPTALSLGPCCFVEEGGGHIVRGQPGAVARRIDQAVAVAGGELGRRAGLWYQDDGEVVEVDESPAAGLPAGLGCHLDRIRLPFQATERAHGSGAGLMELRRRRPPRLAKRAVESQLAAAATPANVPSAKSVTFRCMRSDRISRATKRSAGNAPPVGAVRRRAAATAVRIRTSSPKSAQATYSRSMYVRANWLEKGGCHS